jgi:hypothetical protein
VSLAIVACSDEHRAPPGSQSSGDQALAVDSLRCGGLDRSNHCVLYDVSLVELLARPERFDGRRVRVIGFAHFEFEGNALYLHREDWAHGIPQNGLWLDPIAATERTTSDHYVLVEAAFNARNRGHMGLWSGALEHPTRIDPWDHRSGPVPIDTIGPIPTIPR